ncbi:hypothetical protein HK097_001863, partial [Rhizophlyctis rosea]
YEWGNPLHNKTILTSMLSYSPYNNIHPKPLPSILITGGLNDPRVPYWEPAKCAAKLRAHKTNPGLEKDVTGQGDTPLLLRINGKGHFAGVEDRVEWYAFVLWELGLGG